MRTRQIVSMFAAVAALSPLASGQLVPETIQPTVTLHHNAGSVAQDGTWYLWGGYSDLVGPQRTEKLEIYDPATDTWTYGADCPFLREGQSGFSLGGMLYSVGGEGSSSGSFTSTVHRYDPIADSWDQLSNFPANCWDRYAAVVDNVAYVFGGRVGYGGTDDRMWSFDSGSATWIPRASMPLSTHHGAAASVNGRIYVIAGSHKDCEGCDSHTDIVQAYEPLTDSWSMIPGAPFTAEWASAIVLGDTINVFARIVYADEQPQPNNLVYCFNTVTETWSSVAFNYPTDADFINEVVELGGLAYFAADDRVSHNAYRVTFPAPATITQQPLSQIVPLDDLCQFSVALDDDAGITYQWRRNGVPLSDSGADVIGAHTDTLTIKAAWHRVAWYDVVATGPCSIVASEPALLAIPHSCLGDLDGDRVVTVFDFALFAPEFGMACQPE